MSKNHRVFVAFAKEDEASRNMLKGQARNANSPFEFVDMSVKEPWLEKWKTQCRTKIKGCDGMLALVSKKTRQADGALWEIGCAKQEGVPVRGVYVDKDDKPATLPKELDGVRVVNWTWANIKSFLDSLG